MAILLPMFFNISGINFMQLPFFHGINRLPDGSAGNKINRHTGLTKRGKRLGTAMAGKHCFTAGINDRGGGLDSSLRWNDTKRTFS